MGEFRRASNELRQSLALDDLQNELRSQGSIHKPGNSTPEPPPDQPAQAGADVPGGPDLGTDPTKTDPTTGSATEESEPHPGELTLGNDNEHHDVAEDGAEDVAENLPEEVSEDVSKDGSDDASQDLSGGAGPDARLSEDADRDRG